jgi:hypothetical protein
MRRPACLACAIVLSAAAAAAQSSSRGAAADPWYARATRPDFQVSRGAEVAFQMEWPRRDWLSLPGGGSLLLAFASKKGDAVVLVEQVPLRQPLQPEDLTELFAQLETEAIKERHPGASDFEPRVIEGGDRRLVAVQFARTGVLGSERVRQYSLPVGRQLYRVTCAAAASQFAAYEPIFAHMAVTFSAR